MSLFHLRQLLTLFVSKLGSHLLMRVHHDLVNPSTRVSPNLPELSSCLVDDRRNFGDLLRGQIEFGTEPFFHPSGDPLGLVQFKKMIPRIGAPNKGAGDSACDKHQKEARDKFPLQSPVHFKTHPE